MIEGDICGLDISTSCIGISIVSGGRLVHSEAIDLCAETSKTSSLLERAEFFGSVFYQLKNRYDIRHLFIETPLMRFLPGKSKADTIIKLASFNGMISFITYDVLAIHPTYLNVKNARALYGAVIPRGTKAKEVKKLIIETVVEKEKTAFSVGELTKFGNYKKGIDDKADAVVIARAGEFLLKNEENEGFSAGKLIDY